MEALNKLKVADLKKMLKERNLSTDGNKAVLVQRLHTADDFTSTDQEEGTAATEIQDVSQDTDEELILGNEDSCEDVETKTPEAKSPTKTTAGDLSDDSGKPLPSPTKTSSPSASQKLASSAENGKMGERLKRFGIVTEEAKKKQRAERFQVASSTSSAAVSKNNSTEVGASEEQLKKRAERFGIKEQQGGQVSSGKEGKSELLKKRAERFGEAKSDQAAASTKAGEGDALLKRKARFGASASDEGSDAKKQKRAARFGL